MRNMWLGFALAGLAGCSAQTVTFEHQSELEVATRGVALNSDGRDAVAGMYGTTCRVNVGTADLGDDYNIAETDDEEVQDAGVISGVNAVMVVSELGAHVTYPDNFWEWQPDDVGGPGVLEGRIFNDGFALLNDDCTVDWYSGTDVATTSVGGDCNGAGFTVATASGEAFVANGEAVLHATPDGAEQIGEDADIVVWDAAAEVLYAARSGETTVRGLESDGTLRWSTDVSGGVVSIDQMGPIGQAAVMVARADGTGALLTIDGFTGELLSTMSTPAPANQITTSAGGNSMAMILDREVHFFNVRAQP